MNPESCPVHTEYEGFGDPPDPDCDECRELRNAAE
jgi:hypothetical protein